MRIYQQQDVSDKSKKKLDRKKFMENLINCLVDIDLAQMTHDQELDKSKGKVENLVSYLDDEDESSSFVNEVFKDDITYDIHQTTMNLKNDNLYRAVTFDKSFATEKKQKTKFYRKVCQFEWCRKTHRNNVFCQNHYGLLFQR